MELSLPMAPFPIKFRALVRYRDGLRHGFEFLALSAAQRDEIRRVCEALPPELEPSPARGAVRFWPGRSLPDNFAAGISTFESVAFGLSHRLDAMQLFPAKCVLS